MKIRSVLTCTFVALLLSVAVQLRAQDFSKGIRGDDSDWWSIIRRPDNATGHLNPQNREPAASNFEVLGISLRDEDVFKKAAETLGRTDLISRGDASTGRWQACYVSFQSSPNIFLIFESGEVESAFYLFSDGRPWNGAKYCAKSQRVTALLATGSGLHLGMTRKELENILGMPTAVRKDAVIYESYVRKDTPRAELVKMRQQYPHMSDEDFHESFDHYYVFDYIEARFKNSKLNYAGVDKSEMFP